MCIMYSHPLTFSLVQQWGESSKSIIVEMIENNDHIYIFVDF